MKRVQAAWHKFTWMDVPDGGGGYPMAWKKELTDYLKMPFNMAIILTALALSPFIDS